MADKIPKGVGTGAALVSPAAWEAMRKKVDEIEIIPDPADFSFTRRGGKNFLRLVRKPGPSSKAPPPIPALTLSAGSAGARAYRGVLEWAVQTIRFEKKFLYESTGALIDDVNSLLCQEPIQGVSVMEREGDSSEASSGADSDNWWDLPWWGDVWAKVVLDPATGEPVSWDLVGPEEPAMRPIPLLDSDLSRGSDSGSSRAEFGYAVLIGTVPESPDEKITQNRTGNLEWFCAFVPEGDGSSSSGSSSASSSAGSSSSGSSSASSSAGSSAASSGMSSAGSSKDTAVVPTPWGYKKWYAMEAAEVLFFDFPEITIPRGASVHPIDPIVLFCLHPGTIRAFISPERGRATVRVSGGEIIVRARHWPIPRHQKAQIMLCGTRRDFLGIRNAAASWDDFVDNECRLNPRLTREEILTALAAKGITA